MEGQGGPMIYYSTTVTGIGAEVPDLLDGGVLILYADGAPPALAEISVQHRVDGALPTPAPPVAAAIFVRDPSPRGSAGGAGGVVGGGVGGWGAGAPGWRAGLGRGPFPARQRGGVEGLEQGARVGP